MYCGFSLKSFGQQAKLQLFNDPAPTFIVNLSDSHSDPAISHRSLILLSQFFFPPCSFTLSASLSLAGERQSALGRWVERGEGESGEAAGNHCPPRGQMKRGRWRRGRGELNEIANTLNLLPSACTYRVKRGGGLSTGGRTDPDAKGSPGCSLIICRYIKTEALR